LAAKKQVPVLSARELTHVLSFRAAFSILTLLWFLIVIAVYGFVGIIIVHSWVSGAPLPVSEGISWFLGIGLGVNGVGTFLLSPVIKFYFPVP
jgi:hypothetical protein